MNYDALFESLLTTGFQATHFGQAVEIIRAMRRWRLSDEAMPDDEDEDMRDADVRKKVQCVKYLGYTSNMISCGVRESILYLVKNRMVRASVVVVICSNSTAGRCDCDDCWWR